MKAACLLVCLALARLGAGSIFQRRHNPAMERFVAVPDYVDPYLQEEYQLRQLQQQQFLQQEGELRQPHYRQEQHRGKEQQLYKQQRPQEQLNIRRYADSTSIESGSHESIEALTGRQYDQQYAVPRFADLDTPAVSYRTAEVPAAYGDAIVWRGLQVAAGSDNSVTKKDIERIFRAAQLSTKHIKPENQLKLHAAVVAAQTNAEDTHLNATQLLKKHQYPVEEHIIKTEDGYFLTVFRILPKQQSLEEQTRKVVFLMHGLLGSADDWLLMGPGKSLAYQLADAGYDVYLGNARGNKYTRHSSKSRAQPDFWQYSNDEIALYDLPAMIDYVLKVSKQQQMYYVGHSQGTTAFFALAAARPEYNEKIAMMFALSPMVYMPRVRSPLIRMIAPSSAFFDRLQSQLGNGEFKPSKEVVHTIGGAMCQKEIGCKNMCSNAYLVMSGMNVDNMEPSRIPSIMSHLPAGGSTKQIKHFGQAVDSEEFRMFDYGSEMNMKVYGQNEPPKYDMKKVTVPVVVYYSQDDWMAHPADVERLVKELPHATARKIPQEYFSNTDFQFSKQAPEMVNKNLIDWIENPQKLQETYKQEQQQNNYQQQQQLINYQQQQENKPQEKQTSY